MATDLWGTTRAPPRARASPEVRPSSPVSTGARREELVNRFEAAWQRGQRPIVDDYLPAEGPDREAVLPKILAIDLRYRFRAGEDVRVEEYRQRFAELAEITGAMLQLIDLEFGLADNVTPIARSRSSGAASRSTPTSCAGSSPARRKGRRSRQPTGPCPRHWVATASWPCSARAASGWCTGHGTTSCDRDVAIKVPHRQRIASPGRRRGLPGRGPRPGPARPPRHRAGPRPGPDRRRPALRRLQVRRGHAT